MSLPPLPIWHWVDRPAQMPAHELVPGFYLAAESMQTDGAPAPQFHAFWSPDSHRWRHLATLGGPSCMGSVVGHKGGDLLVELHDPRWSLESVPAELLPWGHNRFLVGGTSVVSFARITREPEQDPIWRFGEPGANDALEGIPVGSRVIRLDGPGMTFVPIPRAWVGRDFWVKVCSAGQPVEDGLAAPVLVAHETVPRD